MTKDLPQESSGLLEAWERREDQRWPADLSIRFRFPDSAAWGVGRSINLSCGGVAFAVDAEAAGMFEKLDAKRCRMTIEIRLGDGSEPMLLEAQIVWKQPQRMNRGRAGRIGARFIAIPDECHARLAAWLAARG